MSERCKQTNHRTNRRSSAEAQRFGILLFLLERGDSEAGNRYRTLPSATARNTLPVAYSVAKVRVLPVSLVK